jgi:hypothetical protein
LTFDAVRNRHRPPYEARIASSNRPIFWSSPGSATTKTIPRQSYAGIWNNPANSPQYVTHSGLTSPRLRTPNSGWPMIVQILQAHLERLARREKVRWQHVKSVYELLVHACGNGGS